MDGCTDIKGRSMGALAYPKGNSRKPKGRPKGRMGKGCVFVGLYISINSRSTAERSTSKVYLYRFSFLEVLGSSQQTIEETITVSQNWSSPHAALDCSGGSSEPVLVIFTSLVPILYPTSARHQYQQCATLPSLAQCR
jgi:hypothetical protein